MGIDSYISHLALYIDERLVSDPLRGRCKSIGVGLNIDDEGSEQNFEPLE
jgi:hypothetical protein